MDNGQGPQEADRKGSTHTTRTRLLSVQFSLTTVPSRNSGIFVDEKKAGVSPDVTAVSDDQCTSFEMMDAGDTQGVRVDEEDEGDEEDEEQLSTNSVPTSPRRSMRTQGVVVDYLEQNEEGEEEGVTAHSSNDVVYMIGPGDPSDPLVWTVKMKEFALFRLGRHNLWEMESHATSALYRRIAGEAQVAGLLIEHPHIALLLRHIRNRENRHLTIAEKRFKRKDANDKASSRYLKNVPRYPEEE